MKYRSQAAVNPYVSICLLHYQSLIYQLNSIYLNVQNIEEVILFQIDMTSKVSKQYSQREFDQLGLGITVEQWIVLKIVSESVLSQRELATKSYRDPASITRTIDLLENKGLVVREAVANNRRTYMIRLTKEGQSFVAENSKTVETHRALSTKGLSVDELNSLSAMLAKIRSNMS